jgi:hypothetical protein
MTVSPVGVHYAGEMKEVNTENLQPLKSGTEEMRLPVSREMGIIS